MEDKKTTLDRAAVLEELFYESLNNNKFPDPKSHTTLFESGLTKTKALDIFTSQIESRHLDLIARKIKNEGKGFYTIGSSGHEGNAAIASAFSVKDMAFLHYRSCAFMLQRARDHFGSSQLRDHLLSLVASIKDPISSGRHKVFGSMELNVPPQTSTIGSHLPKAVGTAFSIPMAKSLQIDSKLDPKSVVLCSFGDGSLNHSTVQGAINMAQWIVAHNLLLPIIFICEDNNLAISTPTQTDWVHKICGNRDGIHYIECDGRNIADVYLAAEYARHETQVMKQPTFLHMKTVRLLGHAGSDIEFHYNKSNEILSREEDDPILHTAKIMLDNNILTNKEIISLYKNTETKINELVKDVLQEPKHNSYKTIEKDIIPPKKDLTLSQPEKVSKTSNKQKYNLAQIINFALDDLMHQYKNIVLFGEDVGKKGGVYRVTANLQKKYGMKRVFDSLLDEQSILGTAIGFAHNNILPIPEIQFLAYVHNAVDQIRGEAATLSFFSSGQFTNPMVIRIPGLAYQKGFGGHFHNDNSIGFLREIPGVIIACPSSPKMAALILRKCVELAYIEQRVVIFLEPIALYHQKDLYDAGDNEFLEHYPKVSETIDFEDLNIIEKNKDVAIITFGNGVRIAKEAVNKLKIKHKLEPTIIDLCWLQPLNINKIIESIKLCKHILILDETRDTGSIANELHAKIHSTLQVDSPIIHKITAKDCFIPLGESWKYILPSVEDVVSLFESKIIDSLKNNSSNKSA